MDDFRIESGIISVGTNDSVEGGFVLVSVQKLVVEVEHVKSER